MTTRKTCDRCGISAFRPVVINNTAYCRSCVGIGKERELRKLNNQRNMEIKKGDVFKRNDGADEFGFLYFEVVSCETGSGLKSYRGLTRNENWEILDRSGYSESSLLDNFTLDTSRYLVGQTLMYHNNGKVGNHGMERRVLGVLGELYLMSQADKLDRNDPYAFWTATDLDLRGYKPVEPPKDEGCNGCKCHNKE